MDTSYKFSYPCKTISNFYDNFYGIHIYDEIKLITYRKSRISEENQDLNDYFILFQLIYSLPIDASWNMYKSKYLMLMNKEFSNEYDSILLKLKLNIFDAIFNFSRMLKKNLKEAFVIYLYIQNQISKLVGYSILLPANLKQECDTILDEKIGGYFIKGFFYMLYKPKKYDLRERIIEKYKNDKDKLSQNIEEVYLFGSVYKNEYNDFSDIDLVIKFKDNITLEDMLISKQTFTKYNKEIFDRRTDIQDYYNYILEHDITKTIKLI